jgi:2-methylcitrate dehydratase PrpD
MLIDKIADYVLDVKFEDFPSHVVEAARLRLIDTLSCVVGGVEGGGNSAMLQLLRGWGGAPQATILNHGDRVPLQHAAMMNCLMGRSFDFEVCGPEPEGVNTGKMVGHVCSTTEPTAFSVAEFMHASGKDLLTAVIIGGDIGARMAVADVFDFDRNFEVCGTANACGAAALVGRLLGANHDQLVNAYGILLHMMAGSYQSLWDGVDTFKLPGALAASNAVVAVQMAMAGFKGVKDPLTSPLGYFAMYGNQSDPARAFDGLGEIFYAKGMHKLHPSCYGNHNPIECALELIEQSDFDWSDIETVELEVPPNRVKHFLNQSMSLGDEQPRSLFSIPYAIANVLVRKSVLIEHYTDPFVRDPLVTSLSERVQLVPRLPLGNNQASRLVVRLRNGEVLSRYRDAPRGWLVNPVTPDDVRQKFWRNIEYSSVIDRENARIALSMLDDLESLADVSGLAPLLVRG